MTDLRLEFERLRRELAAMSVTILALEAENASLKSRLGLKSVNSSIPPSLDAFYKKPMKPVSLREKSGRSSGGQVGGKGETLKMSATPD